MERQLRLHLHSGHIFVAVFSFLFADIGVEARASNRGSRASLDQKLHSIIILWT